MSVTSTTNASFNGELTDSDFNPLFDLIEIVATVAEDLTEWYEDAVDRASTGSDWLNWLREATVDGRSISDQDGDERAEFASWLNTLSFNPKYFKFSNDGERVNAVSPDFKTSEVLELLSIDIDTLSTNARQVLIFTESLIDDYGDSSEELRDLTDALRSAGKGHIRT